MQRIKCQSTFKRCSTAILAAAGLVCLQNGCVDGVLTCQPDSDDPFQGRWTERSSISCDDGSETTGDIGEVIFCQGRFSVTRTPFESLIDYMGEYELNRDTNELTMTVTGGNFIPDDVDLLGTVEFGSDGSIVLRDIYFGTFVDGSTAACGHVLE